MEQNCFLRNFASSTWPSWSSSIWSLSTGLSWSWLTELNWFWSTGLNWSWSTGPSWSWLLSWSLTTALSWSGELWAMEIYICMYIQFLYVHAYTKCKYTLHDDISLIMIIFDLMFFQPKAWQKFYQSTCKISFKPSHWLCFD